MFFYTFDHAMRYYREAGAAEKRAADTYERAARKFQESSEAEQEAINAYDRIRELTGKQ
jgi:hypothetical protein